MPRQPRQRPTRRPLIRRVIQNETIQCRNEEATATNLGLPALTRAALRAFCEGANFVRPSDMLHAINRHYGVNPEAVVVPTISASAMEEVLNSIEPPGPLTISAPPVPDEEEI